MKKRIISAGLVAALALVIFFNYEVTQDMETVEASEGNQVCFDINSSLSEGSGIVKKDIYYDLGTDQNPFTILEIVPNKSMAKIGYFIPGCEPIDMDKMSEDYTKNGTYAGTFKSNFLKTWDGDTAEHPFDVAESEVEYKFADEMSDYNGWTYVGASLTKYGYYEKVSAGSGTFSLRQNVDGSYEFYRNWSNDNYNWVEANVPEDVDIDSPDYNADKVWCARTENSYYKKVNYKLVNNDWLIQDVFEVSSEEFTSQVITVTPDELSDASGNITEIAKYWIDSADLIAFCGDQEGGLADIWKAYNKNGITYSDAEFSNLPTDYASVDIAWPVVYEIIKREAGEVVDSNGESTFPAAVILNLSKMGNNNYKKLVYALIQYEPTAFWRMFGEEIKDGSYKGQTDWNQDTFKTEFGEAVMQNYPLFPGSAAVSSYIYGYVGQNVFSHSLQDDNMITVAASQTQSGGNTTELFDYLNENSETEVTKATPYQAIQYILRQKEYKSKLNILELEACNDFYADDANWETFVTVTFPWFKGDIEKDVTVTKMTTYEFNADITDLNSQYDLILIGDKQTAANGANGYVTSGSGDPLYGKNNQIYTNVGGLILSGTNHNARYGANDITEKKKNELLRYMEGGKPVLVLGDLYSSVSLDSTGRYIGAGVNTQKVDPNTNIYELASLGFLQKYKNSGGDWLYGFDRDNSVPQLYISSNYNQTRLKRATSSQNCEIVFNDADAYPVEYQAIMSSDQPDSTITDVVYQPRTANGESIFTYRFSVKGNSKYTYSVHVFIDQNGDGVYDNSRKELDKLAFIQSEAGSGEELSNVTVMNSATGEVVAANALQANTNYTVSCQLPKNFQGILPWKLEVQANQNSSVRDSVIKYSAIESNSGDRVKIRVLQMDLTQDMTKESAVSWSPVVNFADTSSDVGKKFEKYLDCVKDFDVEIEFEKNADWYKKYGPTAKGTDGKTLTYEQRLTAWKAELDTYDMLILGFHDMCMFTSDDVFYEGFLYFEEQGKSIIMSHDMVESPDALFHVDEDPFNKGTYSSIYSSHTDELRTIVGQRKKYRDVNGNWNYSTAVSNGKAVSLLPNTSVYEAAKYQVDGSSIFYSMIGNEKVSEFADNATYLHAYADYSSSGTRGTDRVMTIRNSKWPDMFLTQYVGISNMGQITEYPYKINSVIPVASTHTQYYSLDLEAADDGDVVVWYNLTDTNSSRFTPTSGVSHDDSGYYSSREGDGANNYYIYNKGNITYTGLGHSSSMTDEEVKLFVNTMIAAYRYTGSSPSIRVTNEDVVVTNSGENVLYVTLDQLNIFTGDSGVLPVHFQVLDEADFTKVANRTYTLSFVDAGGNVLASQPVVYGADGKPLSAGANGYSVVKDADYAFDVSYGDIRKNGSMVYYLKLTSTYTNSKNKEITTETTTKVSILPLGLFDLD